MSRGRPLSEDAILVLFARVPRLGEVKSRLAHDIGDEAALAVYREFLFDAFELMRSVSAEGVQRTVWFTEPFDPGKSDDAELRDQLGDFTLGVQSGEDLGERMQSCLAGLLASGYRRVVIIGADAPMIPSDSIVRAFAALRDRDVVLGPAKDGGYYAVGARTVIPEMFRGIEWGTDTVFQETVKLLKILGVAPVLLPEGRDVDTGEDMRRLAGEIDSARSAGRAFPRHTTGFLDGLGLTTPLAKPLPE
jgi:rSAM/selenodomain-associated transferase 1